MRRTSLWIGLPVLEIVEGERLGVVKDVLFDSTHQATALLVDRDGIFNGFDVLYIRNTRSIGDDAVTVESAGMLEKWQKNDEEYCLLHGDRAWKGKELFTEDGTILGTVADVYIGMESDNIVGYEVSDGLLADLVTGRKWLPFVNTLQIGEKIIVKADATLSEL